MKSTAPYSETVSLFLAALPDVPLIKPLGCEARNREIEAINHPTAKAQKYYVWRLLELAMEQTYGIRADQLDFEKQPSGRWVITGKYSSIHFSLSHCEGAVAVALSHQPVGVDIEPAERLLKPALAQKVLTPDEQTTYDALPATEQNDYLLRAWVSKEAIYKRTEQGSFCPREILTDAAKTMFQTVELNGYCYVVALSSNASVGTCIRVLTLI